MIFDFGEGRPATRQFVIEAPQATWSDYFSRLNDFATKNSFTFRKVRIDPLKEEYGVDLWRADLAISGANVWRLEEFEFAIYIDPDKGGTTVAADGIIAGLRVNLETQSKITVKLKN